MNEQILADGRNFSRAYLIGVHFYKSKRSDVEDHLAELRLLVDTLGVEVVHAQIVKIDRPSPQFLIGSGKMEEIKARLEADDIDLVIFDDDLSPPQQQQWEQATKRAVIDRRKVIIDIFAQRARTKEARLQVELASMEYQLPRLKRAWTHLERQRGGGGFVGGAGEAQIEVDRRIIRERIATVKRELGEVRQQRTTQRKSRERRPVPSAALIGYTNSGKSSLLNAMTGAGVLAEDKLFATLDPTTRRIELPNNQEMLLTDTVGFIRKLPTTLVEAFKATLEEAVHADFLVHVLDASHPNVMEHYNVTNQVLEELGAGSKPTLIVLNKMDLVEDRTGIASFEREGHRVVYTSVHRNEGLDDLRQQLAGFLTESLTDLHLRVPASRFDIVSALHRDGEVLEEKYDENDVVMHVLFPRRFVSRVQQWAV